MFCTACGTPIPAGQVACPKCGQSAAFENPPVSAAEFPTATPPAPFAPPSPIPQLGFELERYRSQINVLSIAWFVYAALSVLFGFAGLIFARHFWMGDFGPRMRGHMPPDWVLQLGWVAVAIRAGLAFVTGWGLQQQAHWGRILAIVAAVLTLFRFPLGTALGIWTLVMLLGYRRAILYEQL